MAKDLEKYTPEEQEDAFYQNLSFGDSWYAWRFGCGYDRINIFTVRQVTEALARYIDAQGVTAQKRGVQLVLTHVIFHRNLLQMQQLFYQRMGSNHICLAVYDQLPNYPLLFVS